MELRKKKGMFSMPMEQAETKPGFVEKLSEGHQPETDEGEELLKGLEEGILLLNTEQRTCIDLFYIKQMSYKNIATKTGYTLLQIKSHIQNGKRNLKIFLEKRS
jgi:RNA polymerase sigma-70 factor (ECF subfamily)